MTKIVHVATLEPEITKASMDPRGIPDNLEALMFAVYASAVLSMSSTQCEEAFRVPRPILAARFEAGAKKALINAGILKSSDFKLLQAFVLWLVSVRITEVKKKSKLSFNIVIRAAKLRSTLPLDSNRRCPSLRSKTRLTS